MKKNALIFTCLFLMLAACDKSAKNAAKQEAAEAAQRAINNDPQSSFKPFVKKVYETLFDTPSKCTDKDEGYGMARNVEIRITEPRPDDLQFQMAELQDGSATFPVARIRFSARISGDSDKGKAEETLTMILSFIAKDGQWQYYGREGKGSGWFDVGSAVHIVTSGATDEEWRQWVTNAINSVEE